MEGEGASLPWLAIYLWLYSGPSCCWFKVRSLAANQAQDCTNTHTATSHAQQRRSKELRLTPAPRELLRLTPEPRTRAGYKPLHVSIDGGGGGGGGGGGE